MALHTYVPQDRLRALARGEDLPERTLGTALFADIAGFTQLTERLTQTLGERRGAESLSQSISAVYDALIGEVERQGGSVIGFAGDAITCWFEAAPPAEAEQATAAARRAAQAAQAMHAAMKTLAKGLEGLSVKVALSSGPARRFAVGDPTVHRIDVLAGATLDRMAQAEHLAQPGEVVMDAPSAALLGLSDATRLGGDGDDVVRRMPPGWSAPPVPPVKVSVNFLPPVEELRPWVLPFVQEREDGWSALFATDLRPVTVLFVRFGGLDYDRDEAAADRLNALVVRTQHLLHQHEGVLLELTVGDKGSYFLACFGAACVHEDDPSRALRAAMALRETFASLPQPMAVQMGLSCGTLRVGGYGSRTRRSFGAMGDDTNAAARLMGVARPGEILVSARMRQTVAHAFVLEARAPIPLKGKAEPMPVFAVVEAQRQRAIRLQEPTQALPLLGRDAERQLLGQALADAAQGRGQLICVSGEAGMGKSRLLAEGVHLARRAGFHGYGGSCANDGVPSPYRVWQDLLLAFFDIDPSLPQRRCVRQLTAELEEHAPEHVEALPVLQAVLGIELPENDFTRHLQVKDRKALLEAVLVRCLQGAAREAAQEGSGILLVLEDLHAIDALSLDLLLQLVRGVGSLPLLVLTSHRSGPAFRPTQLEPLLGLPEARSLELGPLSATQTEQVIRAKLASLFPARLQQIPPALIERVSQRAQGNPFYVEELLNYLHDRGLDPMNLSALSHLELPASLHSLVLSRIDQLDRSQQMVLKVASIIGRSFRAEDPPAYYPPLGRAETVFEDLRELDRLGFTMPEEAARELSYRFRHRVTHEVDYESIPHATRVQLHGLYALYLERQHADQLTPFAAQLAHHHGRAEQHDKAWPYLIQAGEQAAERFANDEALSAFDRALAWMPAGELEARFDLLMRREALLDLLGRHEAQRADLTELAQLAEQLAAQRPQGTLQRARVATRWAKLCVDQGEYAAAQTHCAQALQILQAAPGLVGGAALRVDALQLQAKARFNAGDSLATRALLDEALLLARHHGDRRGQYNTLAQLGVLHWQLGEQDAAEALFAEALQLIRQAGDLRRELDILNNLGVVAKSRGRFDDAIARYEEAQRLSRRIGDRSGEASLTSNIASACLVAGQFERSLQQASVATQLFEGLNEPALQGLAFVNRAEAHRELGQPQAALPLAEQALALFRACGFRRGEAIVLENLGLLEQALGHAEVAEDCLAQAVALAREIGLRSVEATGLLHLGQWHTQQGGWDAARQALADADRLLQTVDDPLPRLEWQAAQAQLALAQGEPAVPWVEPLLAAVGQPARAVLPLRLHATTWQVLQAAGDARAAPLLAQARAELHARSQAIQQSSLRHDFLALPEHQLLSAAP